MKINPYCQQWNCSPLNALFSDLSVIDIAGRSLAMGHQTRRGGENKLFSAKCVNITRQMALTAAALLQTSS